MKFGIFYEMFVPPGEAKAQRRGSSGRPSIRLCLADKHGFDYVWLTEHHFLRGFSHMSAPEVLFGAAAVQTEHIRFGFGLALTPPSYNHPGSLIAERVAMLDCLSNGRVDWARVALLLPPSFTVWHRSRNRPGLNGRRGLTPSRDCSPRRRSILDGEFVKMPARTVVPRPVQKPHPPLWVGGVGRGNAERAAKRGLGMLFFAHKTDYDG